MLTCPDCRRPTALTTWRGRLYCPRCAPVAEVPCVPVTWTREQFQKVRARWERAVEEHNRDVRAWRLHLAPDSAPGSVRVVKRMRTFPADADEVVVPLARRAGRRRASKAGGRPRQFTAEKVLRLRRYIKTHPDASTAKLAKKFKTSQRTIRRYQ